MDLWGALGLRILPAHRGRDDAQILHGILTSAFLSY